MSNSSITSSCPTITRASCRLMLSNASRSWRTAARSVFSIASSVVLMSVSGDKASGEGPGSALVDRDHPLVELQDGQVDGGREGRPDVAAAPGAVAVLRAQDVVEHR